MSVFVCLLISVRMLCRCNLYYNISLQRSKTDEKSRVTIPKQNSKEKEFINPQSRQNRTADISRYRVDKATFKEAIK